MDYPTSIDTFANPTGTDYLDDPSHSDQHAEANKAIGALEAKVGADSSAVTTSHDYKLSGVTGTDKSASKTGAETLTNKTLTSPLFAGLIDGWISAGETWNFSSVDDPTGIFTVSGNVSTKYSAGMRIKLTNGGNTIYGIITAVSYSSPNTSIKFLHQIDPTDSLALHLLADSAITANYYSTQKAPFGFPLSRNSWMIKITDATQRSQSGAVSGTWYNLNSNSITIPIGLYEVEYSVNIGAESGTANSVSASVDATLSTANNSESDTEFTNGGYTAVTGISSGICSYFRNDYTKKILSLASKTVYYFNVKNRSSVPSATIYINNSKPLIIRAICAYL